MQDDHDHAMGGEYGAMGGEYGAMGGEYGAMGGEYGAMGGEYGAMGGEYGAYGGEYGSFDPTIPPPAGELTDAPPGVQDIFAMADAGDITYAEAYEKAEEDFDWHSEAQEDMDGEYGAADGEYGDMATPDPTGELRGHAEGDTPSLDDDIDDDDDDSDWDDDIDDHDHLVDLEDDEDDNDEMESPSGRM